MHYRRERFMIPLIVVGTMLVVAIGLSIYAFMVRLPEEVKKTESEAEARSDLEDKINKEVKDNLALRELIGLKTSENPSDIYREIWTEEIDGKPRLSQDHIKTYITDKGQNSVTSANNIMAFVFKLENYYDSEITKLESEKTSLNVQINTLESAKKGLEEQVKAVKAGNEKEKEAIVKQHQVEIDKLNHEIETLKATIKTKTEYWARLVAENAQLKKENLALNDQIREYRDQVTALSNRIKHQDDVIEELKRGKTTEYVRRIVGEIIMVENGADGVLGSINLGSKDGLKTGIIFEVMHGDDVKGRIRVIQVNEDTAIFQVVVTNKQSDPIIAGDKISSPLFTPGAKPEFVILGRFKTRDFPHSREDIKYMIEQWGGTVVDEISANTRYAIVGDGIEQDELQTIAAYGIERINKARLKDFLETN